MIKVYKNMAVILGLFIFSSVVFSEAKAEIFKCTNLQNEVYYNDKSCSANEVERKIKAVKDPVGGYIAPTVFVEEKDIINRKFVVVGEGENTPSNSSNVDGLSANSGKEAESNRNLDSQGTPKNVTEFTIKENLKNTSTASSSNNSHKYKTEEEIMMTKQKLQ